MRAHLFAILAASLVLGFAAPTSAMTARSPSVGLNVHTNGLITGRSVFHGRRHSADFLALASNGIDGRDRHQFESGGPVGGFSDKN